MSGGDDHYETLDLPPDADPRQVREAWRFLLTAFHPDRFRDPDQRARAEEITKRVNAAWQVLGDPARRARYDRGRPAATQAAPAVAPQREVPCPTCATHCAAPAPGAGLTHLSCPGCGESFPAMIGVRCVHRPRLERRWLGLRYDAVFADDGGAQHAVSFRRLPQELVLTEGEVFSVVFHPRRARPIYAVLHGEVLDVAWRVG